MTANPVRWNSPGARGTARLQGWFYLVTGVWPLLHGERFQRVTGYKVEFWLAQTVGVLLAISGGAFLLAARAGRITTELAFIAVMQAASLAVVDLYCVTQPGTTRVYLLDAIAEVGLVAAWLWAAFSQRATTDPRSRPTKDHA